MFWGHSVYRLWRTVSTYLYMPLQALITWVFIRTAVYASVYMTIIWRTLEIIIVKLPETLVVDRTGATRYL